ncbi:hypothetical protein O1L60_38850 [Streptomyces diastatochromogenes]|nr:hypothetical protein [Streptomyces diastatochromogenes]
MPVLWGTCAEHIAPPPLSLWQQVLRAADTAFPHHPAPGPSPARRPPPPHRPAGTRRPGPRHTGPRHTGPGHARGHRPADTRHTGPHRPGPRYARRPAGDEAGPADVLVRHLGALSASGALVVMLDHVHRADEASLRVLGQVVRRVPRTRLLLVVSYRSGEAMGLGRMLEVLPGPPPARIELRGLGPRDTRALASALVGGEVSARTAEGLCARSGATRSSCAR